MRPDPEPADPHDRLLDELRALAARRDPVPAELLELGRLAWELRDLEAELAELVADSALADERHALVRAGDGPRLLSFTSGPNALELEVARLDAGRRLVGQIVPPAAATVTIEHSAGRRVLTADDLGRFLVDDVPGGVSRLHWHPPDDGPVQTEWFLL